MSQAVAKDRERGGDGANGRRVEDLVREVEPVLRVSRARSEADRRLAPEAMDALVTAGVVRAFLPRAYRGLELGAVHGVRLFEELAVIDSAASWVGMISAAGAWLTILLPATGAEEMLGDRRAVLNGSLFPPLTAEETSGGYRLSGSTAFASGCNYATWFGVQAVVMEDGMPKVGPNGLPVSILAHVPAAAAEIVEHWNTLGMRGTGSHDLRVNDAFVPSHLAWTMGPYSPVNEGFTDPLSRMGLWWFSPLVASVGLGIARAAIADLVALSDRKTPNFARTKIADRPVVQDKIARARAMVDAARSYLYDALESAELAVAAQPKLGIDDGIPLALAASHAIDAARQAVDLVHGCIGTSGIRVEEAFEQYFRDVHTISQHAFVAGGRFESVGKLMLGRESDWPFYYL